MTSRPDILFVVLDTQRADRLSCYGYPHQTSPNLDQLAASSTLFRYAASAAQWTIPSHSTLFTGVYPAIHQTQQSYSVLPPSLPTLAERLSEAGYHTAAYCNNPLVGVVNNGLRRGFDSFLNYAGLLTSRPNQAGKRKTLFGRYRNFFKRYLSNWLHNLQDSFARSDALLDFAMTPFMVLLWQTALSFKGNGAKSLNDAARTLIERKGVPDKKPVFCFINLMGTHVPFHPYRHHVERFAPSMLHSKEDRRYLQKFNSDVLGWLSPVGARMTDSQKALISGLYDAEVATQDEQLGQFFHKLRSSGALDNTFVVITADHGEHLSEKEFVGHSYSLYNELTHVPLIVRDPRNNLPQGTTVDHVVSTRRVFHTMLSAAGIAGEAEQRLSLENYGENDPDRGLVFAEAVTPQNVLNLVRKHEPELIRRLRCDQNRRAIWKGRYKLILTGPNTNEGMVELYDFMNDPKETKNLKDELPEVVNELAEHWRTYERQAQMAAVESGGVVKQDDPNLARRLRALGYLE